jgi:methylase of polypeptide subunit release factors
MSYAVTTFQDLDVLWLPELDGGGRGFGQDFVPVVRSLFGHVGHVFEFCAGPAFIGFSLLAHGLCDALTLADVNPRAVAVARATVRRNALEDRVAVYTSDGLDDLPAQERWDLVVSNPPHFGGSTRRSLILDDPGWALHARFYRRVADFLAPGGSVLLQENSEGSTVGDFLPLLAAGRLRHVQTLRYSGGRYYFVWSQPHLPGLVAET